jgi:hypothetical protein
MNAGVSSSLRIDDHYNDYSHKQTRYANQDEKIIRGFKLSIEKATGISRLRL